MAVTIAALHAAAPENPSAVAPTGGRRELDGATIDACRSGDPAALRAFVVGYQDLVFAFLSRSLGRGGHVEDLAQEVFIRACRALPRFDAKGRARVSTWLLTIATHLVIDARRLEIFGPGRS